MKPDTIKRVVCGLGLILSMISLLASINLFVYFTGFMSTMTLLDAIGASLLTVFAMAWSMIGWMWIIIKALNAIFD